MRFCGTLLLLSLMARALVVGAREHEHTLNSGERLETRANQRLRLVLRRFGELLLFF